MMGDKLYDGKSITDFRDMPEGEHYAILQTASHSIDDGRGGYYQEPYLTYRVWQDRSDWEAAIRDLITYNKSFRAIHVTPARIKVEVNVGID